MKGLALLAVAVWAGAAEKAAAPADEPAVLWQERYLWDGLLQARDRAARVSADPKLIEVVKAVAYQAAQQTANLEQIRNYAKSQGENFRYALAQEDPNPSLKVIEGNFQTLAKGSEQVRNNLYYLTSRLRLCQTQALPDPKLTEMAMLVIAQVQQIQLRLNDLYLDTAATHQQVKAETWAGDDFFRFSAEHLLRAVVETQDSVFTVYNAGYELYLLSQPDPAQPQ
ncbi:MAG: hypothetical protein FD126_1843 [Elusimicrobia bacterium]|nr:MAG: hypothetical protein FD126_1843 [Elusimicrobiota bacterium]